MTFPALPATLPTPQTTPRQSYLQWNPHIIDNPDQAHADPPRADMPPSSQASHLGNVQDRKLVDTDRNPRKPPRQKEALKSFLCDPLPYEALVEFFKTQNKNPHDPLFPPRRKTSSVTRSLGEALTSEHSDPALNAENAVSYSNLIPSKGICPSLCTGLVDIHLARWLSPNMQAYELMFPHGPPICCTHSHKKLRGASLEELICLLPTQSIPRPPRGNASAYSCNSVYCACEGTCCFADDQTPNCPVGGVSKILCHASTYLEATGMIYAFGGLTPQGCSDTLWSLDLASMSTWKRADVAAPASAHEEPAAPHLHAPRFNSNRHAPGYPPVEVRTAQAPCRRFNHTIVGWEGYLVLFGGDGAPGYLDDLWFFDVCSNRWDRISLESEQQSSRPGSRAGHTAVVTADDKMVLFGGWRGADGFSDVWSLDFPSRSWCLLSPHKSTKEKPITFQSGRDVSVGSSASPAASLRPVGRHWHVSGIMGRSTMYVHGGYGPAGALNDLWSYDWTRGEWQVVQVNGPSPQRRFRHACATIRNEEFVIMGGKDGKGVYFNDMWIFSKTNKLWTQITFFTPPWNTFPQCCGHRCRNCSASCPSSSNHKAHHPNILCDQGSCNNSMCRPSCESSPYMRASFNSISCRQSPCSPSAGSQAPYDQACQKQSPCQQHYGDRRVDTCMVDPVRGMTWWDDPEMVRCMPSLHCHSMAYDVKNNVLVITGGCDGECIALDSTLLIRRSPAAAIICFEEWKNKSIPPTAVHSLPSFISAFPCPYTQEILKFL